MVEGGYGRGFWTGVASPVYRLGVARGQPILLRMSELLSELLSVEVEEESLVEGGLVVVVVVAYV